MGIDDLIDKNGCKWCAKIIRDLDEDSELYKDCLCSEECAEEYEREKEREENHFDF
jgi:hypothetical protein